MQQFRSYGRCCGYYVINCVHLSLTIPHIVHHMSVSQGSEQSCILGIHNIKWQIIDEEKQTNAGRKEDAQLFLLWKSLTVQAQLETYGLVRISYHRVLPSSKKRLL